MEYHIQVENIKCGGCINSIKKAVSSIAGVEKVEVNKETETVSVLGGENLQAQLVEKLAELGYPEKGNNNLWLKAKSFVSCAVGRINKED
ncbi:heavy-metal-associated domain-containing protein [Raineya orbicola]|jgi:copper chaperone CopZ|uniref:Copper chaperone n=1 Tax=Raineya orbicola TaxID=2016530 RepID=A0A2N3IIE8_9BACT|nr:heavy metal-associated domain-containing protein [Raineya orbicola]PKQ70003.1 Copper chaperone [Raineya orbicola]